LKILNGYYLASIAIMLEYAEELEDTKEAIIIRKSKKNKTPQWPTERGQTTIYKTCT
jgi:hypothetical protein